MKRKVITGIALTLFLTLAFNIQLVRPVEASTLTPHSPISIGGDSGFVPANGVTGGSGISEDPYIIEGWDIDASQSLGILILNTRAYFIIRNVFIHDGWIDGGFNGISLSNVTNGEVSGASITRNGHGIYLSSSSNNSISGNNITNNDHGISLHGSSNNTVSGNNITNNGFGILLSLSSNNVLSGNNITNNHHGIYLLESSNNTVSGNNIANSYESGVYLYESSNNSISHSNFSNNTQQVYDISWDFPQHYAPSINVWDDGYPSGGNYWSNYTGVDLDHDGIGDSTHVIDANNTDNYPLMGMFSDFNATLELPVQTICNSTISDFQFNGTAICFNVSGEDGTTGFCRICISTALMNDTYKVFVNGTEVPYTLLPCSNSTHNYLYFTYNHSTQEVVIVPEFPTWTSMLLILIVLSFAITIYKRRLQKPRKAKATVKNNLLRKPST